jgi:hypothetical protein
VRLSLYPEILFSANVPGSSHRLQTGSIIMVAMTSGKHATNTALRHRKSKSGQFSDSTKPRRGNPAPVKDPKTGRITTVESHRSITKGAERFQPALERLAKK